MKAVKGLLAKMLLLILVVAILSLAASYTFLTMQQKDSFTENIGEMKDTHRRSAQLLFEQHLQDQILSAQEIVMLSGIKQKQLDDLRPFFDDLWPRIQLSYSLSSMSFTNDKQRIDYGLFPLEHIKQMQNTVSQTLRPQSAIICHMLCELTSTIPVKINNTRWAFSVLTDIAPSIIFLNSVVGSDIGIVSPKQPDDSENNTLSRYVIEVMTGSEKNSPLYNIALSDHQFSALENEGLELSIENKSFYVWFETIAGIGQNLDLIFIRDISLLQEQQENQKQQLFILFFTLTFGILLCLILFSIIPIAKINRLTRAINLIGAKEYNRARRRLGKPSKSYFDDELNELEGEFRHAIDVLETYEEQLNSTQKKLVRQATIDGITGLFTRNVLIEDLGKMATNSDIKNVALFFLDLDGFKPVNDNLGHEAGDIMLKKIGYRLKGVVNKFIKVYRIGGDEFVICYCNYESMDAIGTMADYVVDLFSAPFHIYDTSIGISASIGICMQQANEIDEDQLLRYADIAMYQAKEHGKNRYEFFDDSMKDAAQQRFVIKNDFVSSLAKNQLYLVFQPIVNSRSKHVSKLEALCRWRHPDLGFIPPPTFIDVLEESENMNILFEWIVKNVIKEILYLDTIGRSDLIVSVNLSSSQLVNDDSLTLISEMLNEHKIAASRIEIEITETSLIANFSQAKAWVEKATTAGFKIAIDDFGAGYSSLSYLTAFPYHTVKLDRSLLNNIDKDQRQQRIVGSLTQMLHGLKVPIVAEGAETEEQFNELRALGCDFIQGYLISRPIPHEELVVFLNDHQEERLRLSL